MIIRMTAGTLGLLAFAAAIFAGLWAGNGATVILTRAWWAMILFIILGAGLGWMAQLVINEHLRSLAPREAASADGAKTAGPPGAGRPQSGPPTPEPPAARASPR